MSEGDDEDDDDGPAAVLSMVSSMVEVVEP